MITLEEVYPWLNKFGTRHIRPSSDYLIERLKDSLAHGQTDKARSIIQQLKNLAGKFQDAEEVSEVLIECGRSAFRIGDLAEAEAILEDSVSRTWSNLHKRAMVEWMLGCVQWKASAAQKAVDTWRNSLADFERLMKQAGLPREKHTWYQETYWKLEKDVISTLEEIGKTSVPELVSVIPGKASPDAIPEWDQPATPNDVLKKEIPAAISAPSRVEAAPAQESKPAPAADILQLFSVFDEIPAGGFGPGGADHLPIGRIEVDELMIDGRPCRIYNPHGNKVANLPFDEKVFVVRIKSDSMNEENILPGDYVVLRRVDEPVNGDIVMVEIAGYDSRATLKRFMLDEKTIDEDGITTSQSAITLRPHSSNPEHKPFIFKKMGEGFHIRGVVIAVLKPGWIPARQPHAAP
jgi:hypothetical protein